MFLVTLRGCFGNLIIICFFYRILNFFPFGLLIRAWILFTNLRRLSIEISLYASTGARSSSTLSFEELSSSFGCIFRLEADSAGGGICSLTTSSSPTKVTSTARVSFLLFCATSCFWVPLKPFFLFHALFLKTDCFFPTFGMIYGQEHLSTRWTLTLDLWRLSAL